MDFHTARELWTPTDFDRMPQKARLSAGSAQEVVRAELRECQAEIARCTEQIRLLRMRLQSTRARPERERDSIVAEEPSEVLQARVSDRRR